MILSTMLVDVTERGAWGRFTSQADTRESANGALGVSEALAESECPGADTAVGSILSGAQSVYIKN